MSKSLQEIYSKGVDPRSEVKALSNDDAKKTIAKLFKRYTNTGILLSPLGEVIEQSDNQEYKQLTNVEQNALDMLAEEKKKNNGSRIIVAPFGK